MGLGARLIGTPNASSTPRVEIYVYTGACPRATVTIFAGSVYTTSLFMAFSDRAVVVIVGFFK